MKNRDGFVSNSSSSSFIVHKLVIGETNFNKLIDFLTKLEKSEDYEDLYSWGDSGETWFIKNDYIYIETNRWNIKDREKLATFNVNNKTSMEIDV